MSYWQSIDWGRLSIQAGATVVGLMIYDLIAYSVVRRIRRKRSSQ